MAAQEVSPMAALAESLTGFLKTANERVLTAVRGLDEAPLHDRPNGTNSIGWNLWHVARFADVVQYELAVGLPAVAERLGPAKQLWHARELAARWGLDPAQLGRMETGWEMPESVAHALRPPAAELLDYAEHATALLAQALDLVDDVGVLQDVTSPFNGAVRPCASLLVMHATHVNRHLGMIECLRGQLTGRGTATA
jgi:hypothetical protein